MTAPPPLPPCRLTPNCVSTQAADPRRRLPPIPYTGPLEGARERLLAVLDGLPRTRVVRDEPLSLKVECRTPVFGFVDDVDFCFDDAAKEIHFRSASRVGRWDLGVHRRRMERIRRRFRAAAPPLAGPA